MASRDQFSPSSSNGTLTPTSAQPNLRAKSGSNLNTRRAELRALNPYVDRNPALIRKPDPTKLVIDLRCPPPRAPIHKVYSQPMNWDSQADVSTLNKWRTSALRYCLGPTQTLAEEQKTSTYFYTAQEKSWILRAGNAKMPWPEMVAKFNTNLDGERPPRTAATLSKSYWRLIADGWTADDAGNLDQNNEQDTGGLEDAGNDEDSDLEEGEIREERTEVMGPRSSRPWEL